MKNLNLEKELAGRIELVQKYLERREDVSMAFLFGSFACGLQTEDSDIDIAMYFKPLSKWIEYEERRDFPQEVEVWIELENILGREIDLLILNKANAVLAFDVLETGIPLLIKDRELFLDFYITVRREAEDFYQFALRYWEIYVTSASLTPQQKIRLLERVQFLKSELSELPLYQSISFETYMNDKIQRRNIERLVENVINATIDIAQIILASEKKEMPKSYKEVMLHFGYFFGLNEEDAKKFSGFAILRNILAHEYLDILYERIKEFSKNSPPIYERLMSLLESYLS